MSADAVFKSDSSCSTFENFCSPPASQREAFRVSTEEYLESEKVLHV